jgi:hypothetical protein
VQVVQPELSEWKRKFKVQYSEEEFYQLMRSVDGSCAFYGAGRIAPAAEQ